MSRPFVVDPGPTPQRRGLGAALRRFWNALTVHAEEMIALLRRW